MDGQCSCGCEVNYMVVIMDMEEKLMRWIPHVPMRAS